MIRSFKCKDTEALHLGHRVLRWISVEYVARRKLAQLQAAETLFFLRAPPGNRLELLSGDRAGQYSMRINDRYRLCFVWTVSGPIDVEIVDYH